VLSIVSSPPGALILVNGVASGTAPLTVPAAAGQVEVEARLPRHRPSRRHVQVLSGEKHQLHLELPELSATLSVNADVPQARVLLDGQPVGLAPVLPRRLAPGRHALLVERSGHHAWGTVLDLQDAQAASVTVRLSRGRLSPAWFATLVAASAVLLATGGGLQALSQRDGDRFAGLHQDLSSRSFAPSALPGAMAQARRLADSREAHATQATALFATGGVLALTATVMAIFTRWGRSEGRVAIGAAP
jgi:hypothetical protein